MKRFVLSTILALTAFAAVTTANPGALQVAPGSKLWLAGSSTMHDFTSKATKLQATFEVDPSKWGDAKGAEAIEAMIRAKGVTGLKVVVPVTGMRSGKDGLDKNMVKALRGSEHPEIRFVMDSYEVKSAEGSDMAIDATGKLTVAGVEREVKMAAKTVRQGETLRLTGNVPLKMTQFGIKPPTMMMGALRTADPVVVHFDLLVAPASASAAKAE